MERIPYRGTVIPVRHHTAGPVIFRQAGADFSQAARSARPFLPVQVKHPERGEDFIKPRVGVPLAVSRCFEGIERQARDKRGGRGRKALIEPDIKNTAGKKRDIGSCRKVVKSHGTPFSTDLLGI